MRTSLLVGVTTALLIASCAQQAGSTTSSSTIAPTTTTTPPTTTLRQPSFPIVAYGAQLVDGEPAIAFLDPDSGESAAVLVDAAQLSEGAGDLSFDPSAGLVYFSRVMTACSSEIVTVDPATGDLVPVASGSAPAVSPDGRHLAYAQDPVCQRHHDVRIRDLIDGSERVWVSEVSDSSDLIAAVTRLSWSPDGQQLVVEVVLEDGSEIRILDVTTDGGEIFDGIRLQPGGGATWTAPVFLADGSIVVAEACCDIDADSFRLAFVDASTSQTVHSVELADAARPLDEHPTAEGILLVSYPPSADSVELWQYVDGELEFVAKGVTDAAWLVGHAPIP